MTFFYQAYFKKNYLLLFLAEEVFEAVADFVVADFVAVVFFVEEDFLQPPFEHLQEEICSTAIDQNFSS